MTRSLLALLLTCTLAVSTAGQQPAVQTTTPATEQDEVVHITTNLVQVDAVVTDRSGKQITDLSPTDFEIYEDGHPQAITNFSYVKLQPVAATAAPNAAAKARRDPAAPPAPPLQLRPEQVRRTMALVVDDLGLSFESMYFVRKSLKKFVDEQVQPGDLVAVIRTGAGIGALQQFTTDKRLLYAAIERIKWNPQGRSVGAFAPIDLNTFDTYSTRPSGPDGTFDPSKVTHQERDNNAALKGFRDTLFSVGTLGALNFIVRGLRELPGRKSIVLLSDTLSLLDVHGETDFRTIENVRRLTDLANRATAVIYTIDARGLQPLNLTAADGAMGTSSIASTAQAVEQVTTRSNDFFASQTGLNYLARQTGGFFVQNNNDLNQGLGRVLQDQQGYYLIGYRPDAATFDPATGQRSFHRLEVRAKRADLSVRTRTGFYGIASADAHPVYRTREQQLLAAITSPFASGALDLRLTSIYLNDQTYGSFIRSLIHVDGHSLTFADAPDGTHKATVDVAAMTFGDDGIIVDQRFRTETLQVRDAEYRAALRDGLTFGINLPIKQPGAFQLRIAVRDAATERVGSANQFIEVPNLGQHRLTLSGLYVAGNAGRNTINAAVQTGTPAATTLPSDAGTAEGQLAEADPQAGPAVRRFRPGMVIDYGYEAYNARLDSATHRPHLQTQVRLFHDNQQAFAGKVLDVAGQLEGKRLVVFGHVQLGQNLPPGDYILQVLVSDVANRDKPRITSQWLPFEIE